MAKIRLHGELCIVFSLNFISQTMGLSLTECCVQLQNKWLPIPVWCGHFGVAVMVQPLWCIIRCGDSMVLVFYGARQCGAMVRRIFLLFGIFGGPYKGRFLN